MDRLLSVLFIDALVTGKGKGDGLNTLYFCTRRAKQACQGPSFGFKWISMNLMYIMHNTGFHCDVSVMGNSYSAAASATTAAATDNDEQ